MKVNIFRTELTDISAKEEALVKNSKTGYLMTSEHQ